MHISRTWLQSYFEATLPPVEEIASLLTFHSFEIDGVEGDVLDVKITANRGHDCLSHVGIARELSAILRLPLVRDPLREPVSLIPASKNVSVSIDDPSLCGRYIAAYIEGVRVQASPQWLREWLESIGQRSINNIVDATNFVMFGIGQPLHAFDARRLQTADGTYSIQVRTAHEDEHIEALDGKEYTLPPAALVISDAVADVAIGIAGIKGGMPASITEETTSIIIESAHFDGPAARATAAALRLRTDASSRFEHVLAPELAAIGMREVVATILSIAGGSVEGYADVFPRPSTPRTILLTRGRVSETLGIEVTDAMVEDSLQRLGISFETSAEGHLVHPPFERIDLVASEDIVEEIARIIGYDRVPSVQLPPTPAEPTSEPMSRIFRVREKLIREGYSEVYTSVFSDRGSVEVLNKVGGEKPFLRESLVANLSEALERNIRMKDFLALDRVKLFEIGTVWRKGSEQILVGVAEEKKPVTEVALNDFELSDDDTGVIERSHCERYAPYSKYPYIVRDIALWVPATESEEEVRNVLVVHSGDLAISCRRFDRFEKEGRVSYAFRIIFQSFDRTLTDTEVGTVMQGVTEAVTARGWSVR